MPIHQFRFWCLVAKLVYLALILASLSFALGKMNETVWSRIHFVKPVCDIERSIRWCKNYKVLWVRTCLSHTCHIFWTQPSTTVGTLLVYSSVFWWSAVMLIFRFFYLYLYIFCWVSLNFHYSSISITKSSYVTTQWRLLTTSSVSGLCHGYK